MLHELSLLAETNTLTAVFLGVMVIVVAFLLMRSGRYFRQRRDATPDRRLAGRFKADRGADLSAEPGELLEWDLRMHETARALSGQLDSKMSALQALILDADRAAARLEQATGHAASIRRDERAETHQAARLAAGEHADLAESHRPTLADRRKEEVYTLADYGYPADEIAQRTGIPAGEVELILGLRRQG